MANSILCKKMNTLLFISSIILSVSGFVIAFYGILATSQIKKITALRANKGIRFFGDEYSSHQYNKWKAGSYFTSKAAVPAGLLISLTAGIAAVLDNPWWTFIVVLLAGYGIYLVIAKIIGCYIQIVSMLTLTASTVLIIMNFLL